MNCTKCPALKRKDIQMAVVYETVVQVDHNSVLCISIGNFFITVNYYVFVVTNSIFHRFCISTYFKACLM